MLHWLAGKTPPEAVPGAEDAGYFDPPETPAPVFAVRAFKQAIFGTPQTSPNRSPRRNSNTEHTRPRPRQAELKPNRPKLPRPKSTSDPRSLYRETQAQTYDVPPSPTKGILLTPGTATTKRKTVTFGEEIVDPDIKRSSKSGIPDDCPGKFPSPWTKPSINDERKRDELVEPKGKSRLTEALEEARDESAKKRSRGRMNEEDKESADTLTVNVSEPTTECGRYWKAQYDSYRVNTQREVKKLILKRKAAKSFAQQKEQENLALTVQLRQEREKVAELEQKSANLELQLRNYLKDVRDDSQQLRDVTLSEPAVEERRRVAAQRRHETRELVAKRATAAAGLVTKPDPDPELLQTAATIDRGTKVHDAQYRSERRGGATDPGTASRKPDKSQTLMDSRVEKPLRSNTDDKAQSEYQMSRLRVGRTVTSGTDMTPLQSLNVNTMPVKELTRRDSAQALPFLVPIINAESRHEIGNTRESVTEITSCADALTPKGSPSPTHRATVLDALVACERQVSTGKEPLVSQSEATQTSNSTSVRATARPLSAKENVKPSTAWSSMHTQTAPDGKRQTALVDRSGREIGRDRVEAARARLQARGRNVS